MYDKPRCVLAEAKMESVPKSILLPHCQIISEPELLPVYSTNPH